MKLLIAIASLLGIAFIGCLAWALLTTGQLNDTREILAVTQSELQMKISELAETEGLLADTRHELAETRTELTSARSDLYDTRSELLDTKSELVDTGIRLSSAESRLNSTTAELAETQDELITATDTLKGLGITLSISSKNTDASMIDNTDAANPTWAELMEFLAADRTDEMEYIIDEYDCSEFSRDVHNKAEAAGIRAAVVHIDWSNSYIGHAVNAFLTDDYGLVYIDCISDDLAARIKKGKTYRGMPVEHITASNIRDDSWWDSLGTYYYIPAGPFGEAVTGSITIFW